MGMAQNLLKLPWSLTAHSVLQVQNAQPLVDTHPPQIYSHLCLKFKKLKVGASFSSSHAPGLQGDVCHLGAWNVSEQAPWPCERQGVTKGLTEPVLP